MYKRQDFDISAEIIVIALGTVAAPPLTSQLTVLASIGLIMKVGVYGIVAGIVKMDDVGFYLLKKTNATARFLGQGLVLAAPKLMKALTIIGTAAMFMVGGGFLSHGLPPVHHALADISAMAGVMSGPLSLALPLIDI